MKTEWFKMRMSERRLNKLRLYAAIKDTTMTHVVEDLIDSLKIPENGHSSHVSPGGERGMNDRLS